MNYSSRSFLLIWISIFLATFAISISSSPLPYLIRDLVSVAGDPEKTEKLASIGISIAISLNSVAVIAGSYAGGFVLDRIGRKKAIVLAFTVLASGFVLFVLSQSAVPVFVASFLQKLGYWLAMPSFDALVAGLTSPSSRGTSYGFFNISWMAAQIPGPFLGGLVADVLGLRAPFILGLVVSFLTVVLSTFIAEKERASNLFEKTLSDDADREAEESSSVPLRNVLLMFGTAFLLNGIANGAISAAMNSFMVFYLKASTTEFGLAHSLGFGFVGALVQVPGGKLADKFGRKPLVLFSFLIVPLIPLLAISKNVWQFTAIMGFIVAIGNIGAPATTAWLMDSVEKSKRASASGIVNTINGAGSAVGPIIGGGLWNLTDAIFTFGVIAAIFSASFFVYLKIKETRVHKDYG